MSSIVSARCWLPQEDFSWRTLWNTFVRRFPVDWAAISAVKTIGSRWVTGLLCIWLGTFLLFLRTPIKCYVYVSCLCGHILLGQSFSQWLNRAVCERARWGVGSNSGNRTQEWIKQTAREETNWAVIGLCGFSWPPFYWKDIFFSKCQLQRPGHKIMSTQCWQSMLPLHVSELTSSIRIMVCWLRVLFLSGLDRHGLRKLALCEGPGGSFSVGALVVLSDWWVVITGLGLSSSFSRAKCGNVALENPRLMTSGNNAQVDPQHHNWNACEGGKEKNVAENRVEGSNHSCVWTLLLWGRTLLNIQNLHYFLSVLTITFSLFYELSQSCVLTGAEDEDCWLYLITQELLNRFWWDFFTRGISWPKPQVIKLKWPSVKVTYMSKSMFFWP